MGPQREKRGRDDPQESDVEKGNSNKSARKGDDNPGERTLVVTQLTSKVNEEHLRDFFGQIDEVRDVAMPRNDNGKHKGVAYVEFTNSSNIPTCLLLNNTVPDFQKFPILVEGLVARAAPTPAPAPPPPPAPLAEFLPPPVKAVTNKNGVPTKALLMNIPLAVQDGDLRSVLSFYGAVNELHLSQSPGATSGGKMAYVTFADETAARSAREMLHKFELVAGQKLDVSIVKEGTNADASGLRPEVKLSNLPARQDAAVEVDIKNECVKAKLGDVSVDKVCDEVHRAEFMLRCASVSDALRAEKAIDGRFYRGRLVSAQVELSK